MLYLLKHCPHAFDPFSISTKSLQHLYPSLLEHTNPFPATLTSHPSFNIDPLNTSTSPLHQLHLSASTLTSFLYNSHKPPPQVLHPATSSTVTTRIKILPSAG
ncbi:hypothetical protein Pmani_017891 [Petrolisthes manimaculis]|uniref:Uncharacterized protein n=1 Tax=Petrolisthes manimaculis TaxID=1843537 RepID=A0AAE1U9C0_9EUCA|nr:hypothetical protein Pmani_017891 [Petrolisthes manimaculis]